MIFKILLIIHVISGMASLVIGGVAILVPKNRGNHTLFGKMFCILMGGVVSTAIPMGYMHNNYFLISIGIFSSYFVISGLRAFGYRLSTKVSNISDIENKSVPHFKVFDQLFIIFMLIVNCVMICFYIYQFRKYGRFMPIPIFFALSGIFLQVRDYKSFQKKHRDKFFWLEKHIVAMSGGYISIITAFLVTNSSFLPVSIQWINWVWPGVFGGILIGKQIKKIRTSKR